MIQETILLLVEGLAIGFLLGIGTMLLFSEHLRKERVKPSCAYRLAQQRPDLTPISRQHGHEMMQKQCKMPLAEMQRNRWNKRPKQMDRYDKKSVAMLTTQDGTQNGSSWLLRYEAETTIGSVKDCDIVLEEHDISRFHAQIVHRIHVVTTHDFAIFDYSSTNNTKLNGQPVNGVASLKDGDNIQIGKAQFIFRRV